MKRSVRHISSAPLIVLLLTTLLPAHLLLAGGFNGFELKNASINRNEVYQGGPPKDGIPALTHPRFVKASKATFLQNTDRVIGVVINGISKAYPIKILNWHEIVNDKLDNQSIVISYCPLCGTGMVFDSEVAGEKRHFGVSGLLYNSDVLLYDKETESLWSQIMQQAVAGKLVGEKLRLLVSSHTNWKRWRERYPDTLVLSQATGYRRDYQRNPYASYAFREQLYFPVSATDNRLTTKSWVIGLSVNGRHKAYPFDNLRQFNGEPVHDQLGGQDVTIYFDPDSHTASVKDADNIEIPIVTAYWFAWYAFYPDTALFE